MIFIEVFFLKFGVGFFVKVFLYYLGFFIRVYIVLSCNCFYFYLFVYLEVSFEGIDWVLYIFV